MKYSELQEHYERTKLKKFKDSCKLDGIVFDDTEQTLVEVLNKYRSDTDEETQSQSQTQPESKSQEKTD